MLLWHSDFELLKKSLGSLYFIFTELSNQEMADQRCFQCRLNIGCHLSISAQIAVAAASQSSVYIVNFIWSTHFPIVFLSTRCMHERCLLSDYYETFRCLHLPNYFYCVHFQPSCFGVVQTKEAHMYNGEYTNIGVVRTGGFILSLNFFFMIPCLCTVL